MAAEAGLKLRAVTLGRQWGGAVVAGLGDRSCSHDPWGLELHCGQTQTKAVEMRTLWVTVLWSVSY